MIDSAKNQPLIGFDFEDVATGTFLRSIDFSCTWIDNEVPHPLQEQDFELWSDVYTGHPVSEIEGNASSASIDLAHWVPYTFHFEGIWFGTGTHRIAFCSLIAAFAEICGGLIYFHDGGLPFEYNGFLTEEFLIWCKGYLENKFFYLVSLGDL